MGHEREPQKEPSPIICHYCGAGTNAKWEITTDHGAEFVCEKHHSLLNKMKAIQKERLLSEAEWMLTSHHEEDRSEHEFDDTDQWEDGSLFDF